jgi:hypothetical protein
MPDCAGQSQSILNRDAQTPFETRFEQTDLGFCVRRTA